MVLKLAFPTNKRMHNRIQGFDLEENKKLCVENKIGHVHMEVTICSLV